MIASRELLLDDGNGMMGGADVVSKATLGAKETEEDLLLDASSASNNRLASEIMEVGEECKKTNLNSTGTRM